MAALGESGPDANADDPFVRLGLSRDAGFEQVQAAKARCLAEVSGDDQARAKIEAAYDAVLMARLRDRQQGQVSAAAATASERGSDGGIDALVVCPGTNEQCVHEPAQQAA